MARNTSKGPTPVDSIKHDDKRTNIPTADAHEFVDAAALEEVRQVRYARDERSTRSWSGAASTRRPTTSTSTTTTWSPTRRRSTSRRRSTRGC